MRILFVCLGNICRSPTADAICRDLVAKRGLSFTVDGAGTSAHHVGEPPYGPMQCAARAQGVDMSDLRSRQFTRDDFEDFDLIIAMDQSNQRNIEGLRPRGNETPVRLLLEYLPNYHGLNVPDPYYTGTFDEVFGLIRRAVQAMLDDLGA